MKLYNINNIDSFTSCIRSCAGNVNYKDRFGNTASLKAIAESGNGLLSAIKNGKIDEIEVQAALRSDTDRLFRYAMEARRE